MPSFGYREKNLLFSLSTGRWILLLLVLIGCRSGTRTPIPSSRGMCPTIRRIGNLLLGYSKKCPKEKAPAVAGAFHCVVSSDLKSLINLFTIHTGLSDRITGKIPDPVHLAVLQPQPFSEGLTEKPFPIPTVSCLDMEEGGKNQIGNAQQ